MDEITTKSDWKITEIEQTVTTPYARTYTQAEFETLKRGVKPHSTDDKWFIYYEQPYLHLHRSWTGIEIFRLNLTPTDTGANVREAVYDPSKIKDAPPDYAADMLGRVIDDIAIGKPQRSPQR